MWVSELSKILENTVKELKFSYSNTLFIPTKWLQCLGLVWFQHFSWPGPADFRLLSAGWFRGWWPCVASSYTLRLANIFTQHSFRSGVCLFFIPSHQAHYLLWPKWDQFPLYQLWKKQNVKTWLNWYHVPSLFQGVVAFLINFHLWLPN